jgi:hypothetical protein
VNGDIPNTEATVYKPYTGGGGGVDLKMETLQKMSCIYGTLKSLYTLENKTCTYIYIYLQKVPDIAPVFIHRYSNTKQVS